MSKVEHVIKIDKGDVTTTIDISEYEGTNFNNVKSSPYDQLYEWIFDKHGEADFKDLSVSNFCVSEKVGAQLYDDLKNWVEVHPDAQHSNKELEVSMLYLDRSTVTVEFEGIEDDKLYIRKF